MTLNKLPTDRQFFPFWPVGVRKPFHITYRHIIGAMNKVSKARKKKTTGRKYAVMNPDTGETFSPKEILRTIIGTDFVFLGGKGPNGANRLFSSAGVASTR